MPHRDGRSLGERGGHVRVASTAYLSDCLGALIARRLYEAGLVDQWIEFAKNELDLPVGMWIYPILGFIQSNKGNTERAQEDLKRGLAVLQAHLTNSTYLVGNAVTLADIVVACVAV